MEEKSVGVFEGEAAFDGPTYDMVNEDAVCFDRDTQDLIKALMKMLQ